MYLWNTFVWFFSCVIALFIFLIAGYFIKNFKRKHAWIFFIAEFLLYVGLSYLFMLIIPESFSLMVAVQPMFLAASFVTFFTILFSTINKNLTKNIFTKIYEFFYRKGFIVIGCLGIVILMFGFFNTQKVVETDYKVKSDKIENSYNIVFLSDVHYPDSQLDSTIECAVNDISSLNADAVIIGGDLIDDFASKESMQKIIDYIAQIKTKYGIYFVEGNHELLVSTKNNTNNKTTYEEVFQYLNKSGIKIINDKSVDINSELSLIGKSDLSSENRLNNCEVFSKLDNNKFNICIEHQPQTFDENCQYQIDLQLSGHNHYGQLFPLGFIGKLSGMYIYGPYYKDSKELIVTSGFGAWQYPIRTGKNCEFLLIQLQPNN